MSCCWLALWLHDADFNKPKYFTSKSIRSQLIYRYRWKLIVTFWAVEGGRCKFTMLANECKTWSHLWKITHLPAPCVTPIALWPYSTFPCPAICQCSPGAVIWSLSSSLNPSIRHTPSPCFSFKNYSYCTVCAKLQNIFGHIVLMERQVKYPYVTHLRSAWHRHIFTLNTIVT